MHPIAYSRNLASSWESLFDKNGPIPIRLWAMLDGTIEGRILVNRPDTPTVVLIQELAEGTTYIGGVPTAQTLVIGLTELRRHQEVVVCLWPSDPLQALLPPAPDYTGVAIDFTDRSCAVDLKSLATPPDSYQLRRIDATIVPRLAGFDYYAAMFGGVERAVQNTIGYCVLWGEKVVSEAVAGPLTRGMAEIGVGTAEAFRRKGLATVAAARVIQEVEANGYQPFWNASYQNTPSVALAKRLGFQTEKPFNVFAWSPAGM